MRNILTRMTVLLSGLVLTTAIQAADLTVYTYDSFLSEWGPGPQLEKAFEQQCQCDIEFIGVEDGVSILNRLRIEGKRNKADVILGIDDALMEETRATGLIAEHQQDLSTLKAELNWTDSQFVPVDYGYFAFIYDSRKISQPITSLKALVESDARVLYQDPRTSTPGQGLMMWMKAVYGDQADQGWQQLAGHTVTVTKGWWEAYSMFLKGSADYVLSYTTSPAYHQVNEQTSHYKAAPFSEGHIAQIELAAVTATSDNPELARRFVRFLTSDTAQQIIPVTNWMLPVRNKVTLPEAFDTLIQPERIGFSASEMAEKRRSWLREWRNAAAM